MKILIAITKSNFGGAQRYVYDLATSLQDRHDVTVIFGGEGLLAEKLRGAGVKTISLSELGRDISFFTDVRVAFKLRSLFKKEKPDAIILNSSKVGGVGSFAGRLAGIKKIIFVAHGWAWNEDRSSLNKLYVRFLYSLIGLFSTKIIAVSDMTASQGHKLFFGKKKITVVKNGMKAPDFLEKDAARSALGLPADTFTIGTIAELHPIKGLEYAIEAMSMLTLSDFRYIILGEGENRKKLETLIKEKRLEDKVILKGFVKDAETYLKAFDIFVLPSLSEALAYVILEAGNGELPVIASYVGGIPEIITNEETGLLIRPKNPKEIAHAIEILRNDGAKSEMLAKNLREKVTSQFSLEKMVSETEKIITN